DDDWNERLVVSNQAQTFIDALNKVNMDYQIAVTTTDTCHSGKGEYGRLLGCPGCHIDGQTPTIITPSDANAGAALKTLMQAGGRGTSNYQDCFDTDEQFFETAYRAVVGQEDQAYNQPLVRETAYLAIIETNMDDEDDNSRQETPQWYANQLLSVKGADHPE